MPIASAQMIGTNQKTENRKQKYEYSKYNSNQSYRTVRTIGSSQSSTAHQPLPYDRRVWWSRQDIDGVQAPWACDEA
jgi:hypothetical protein